MCGRFGISANAEQLALLLEITPSEVGEVRPRFNIAPSTLAPIVRHNSAERRALHWVRWGLVPSWAKTRKIGHKLINARSETVNIKPAFRAAFERRRCLVIADGFYEWRRDEGAKTKQAYHIGLSDESAFAMAGLWERHTDPVAGDTLDTFTVLTTEANDVLAPLHHRMPVILPPQDYETWLCRESDPRALLNLLRPCPSEILVTWPVSPLVNSPKHQGAECRSAIQVSTDAPGAKAS
uniref:Abasic site processing protein n=3 Tax=environmental samples TaxID=48479 RepID=C7FPD2_9BACT|nr:uncharacterized conserved protein [uncultured bacterium HF186_25m_30B18]ACU26435.1 uncharacterized conserved protein [uncultured bacterium HF186_75m_14K15]ACU26486.1 uncharacterized conserved protein [uncultured bacterium HF186_25m_13D19]